MLPEIFIFWGFWDILKRVKGQEIAGVIQVMDLYMTPRLTFCIDPQGA